MAASQTWQTRFALAVVLGALLLGGCVESSMLARTRMELEAGIPGARFEREHSIHLGRISSAVLRPIALWAVRDEGDESAFLRRIRRVDFALYEVVSFPDSVGGDDLASMERRLRKQGWNRMVRAREEAEITWIFNRQNGAGEIRDLFVVTVDDAEMVIVRVSGRLDQALAELIADDPSGFGASLGG